MSAFWNAWVWVLVVGNLVGCMWLLQALSRRRKDASSTDTTGHTWDGDLVEYNNPLPRWWLVLFWVTAVFMVAYLAFFPGLGGFAGMGGWSQKGQYETEVAAAERRYGNVYAAFAEVPTAELVGNVDAMRLGRNLFLNRCATCHGSDGRGAKGFPNLTDSAWLWGGDPASIEATIANGRTGVMPALGAALGDAGVDAVIAWLRALPSLPPTGAVPPALAAGQQAFATYCAACHGADGRGMPALGAPNLADEDWLHGGSDADIRDVLMKGRINQMPAQSDTLTPDRIHVLAAYVLGLGGDAGS